MPTILLTNDDGIEAPGLKCLRKALEELADIVVIAPDQHLSGCSHQTTTHRPLRVTQVSQQEWCVDGTPADCVRLGLCEICPDAEWVLSGVNDGGNLGIDVVMSGTVAAAREAVLLERKAIAFSHYRKGPIEWQPVVSWVHDVFRQLTTRHLSPCRFWNVNFPDRRNIANPANYDPREYDPRDTEASVCDLKGPRDETRRQPLPPVDFCEVDRHPLPIRFEKQDTGFVYRGDYHTRRRKPGTDVDVCFSGRIAISQIAAHWV